MSEEKIKCPKCGNEINVNQKFCSNCGASLNGTDKSWIKTHYNTVIVSAVIGLLLVCGYVMCIHTNKSTQFKTTVDTQNVEFEETGSTLIEGADSEDTAEDTTQQPTAPKPKCIYETSDGICFTTKEFVPEPLNYHDCTGGLTTYGTSEPPTAEYQHIGINACHDHYDFWAGAMKMCNDWGYKLPSDYELSSLANDLYGTKVSNDINVKSYLPDGHKENKNIISALGMDMRIHSKEDYWEDSARNDNTAYIRSFYNYNVGAYTYRHATFKQHSSLDNTWHTHAKAICVYNPYGKAKTSYSQYVQKKQQQAKIQQQQKQEQMKKEAEDALF